MPIRIEIELTSSSPDGSWTWRAAGAREPRGVLDGSILPGGAEVGDQFRVETEKDVDGIRVLAVVPPKEKAARSDVLELLPTDEAFEPVVQHRAPGRRDDGDRRPRRDRPPDDRGDRRRDRGGEQRARRPADGERRSDRPDERRGERRGEQGERRHRPHFTPPPEVPQRPKPKRLRPGKQHVTDLLASLPEEQRPVAELAQQGISAVRQRLREENARLAADGKPTMPEAAVMKMAEDLVPKLRVADWLDRAEAAQRQLAHLDLRDLRSVVAASDDPVVARDESTLELAKTLKAALVTKQEEELALWLTDVEAALDVGRVVRALRLSSVPPKAGVPFPGALASRLSEATTASLQPTDGPDRWAAVLEAAAFSPVRAQVTPAAAPEQRSDELVATVRRLGPLLPQVAALFDIEVPKGAAVPKPLRPTPRRPEAKKQAPKPDRPPRARGEARPQPPPPKAGAAAPAEAPAATAEGDTADAEPVPVEASVASEVSDTASAEPVPVEASVASEVSDTADAERVPVEASVASEVSDTADAERVPVEASVAGEVSDTADAERVPVEASVAAR